ncbi:MAG: hypothetical protein P9X27_00320 [Candidatus Kaelpia aquatica]|nr:hypothetical protein [Candidatus Kaelpia aquatica]
MSLQLEWIIFSFLFLPLAVIILLWLLSYREKKSRSQFRKDNILECEICYGVYKADSKDEISKCPFCGSYNKREPDTF